ncbi:hypothetical protein [Acrocarpospora sp. B8E8]|uniref:hypothetical protein n=1 Tax=Acrocarpospora sp. B8E8 TaxID=3153572 RepID=UPI00325E32A0
MKTTAIHKRAAATLAIAALTTLATVPVLAQPALAESTQAAGRCTLTITQLRGDLYVIAENSCSPRLATDTLTTTRYMGADWPDPDDTMLYRNYPGNRDRFKVAGYRLDEDAATGDEIYTRNFFRRADGSSYEINSNEVHKEFLPLVG